LFVSISPTGDVCDTLSLEEPRNISPTNSNSDSNVFQIVQILTNTPYEETSKFSMQVMPNKNISMTRTEIKKIGEFMRIFINH
jgi:hypothetical protein